MVNQKERYNQNPCLLVACTRGSYPSVFLKEKPKFCSHYHRWCSCMSMIPLRDLQDHVLMELLFYWGGGVMVMYTCMCQMLKSLWKEDKAVWDCTFEWMEEGRFPSAVWTACLCPVILTEQLEICCYLSNSSSVQPEFDSVLPRKSAC